MQETARNAGADLLDQVHQLFGQGEVASAMRRLFVGLDDLRVTMGSAKWREFAGETVTSHPLLQLVHEDPMVARSYSKPRGYAGDAVLLDYLYGIRGRDGASERGRQIAEVSAGRGPAAAVRHRRDLIAYRIDQLAERSPRSVRALSVACGHLREGRQSIAVQTGNLEELVALDSDPQSLLEVAASSPGVVTTCELSVRRLLAGRADLGSFDFVYSAGLYDYLEDRTATSLTAKLFAMLRPGGRLLFCNFLPNTPDAGYMETFMGWQLIYRSLGQIVRLAGDVPREQLEAVHRYEDGFGSVGYVELQKRK